jgi:hypothetical protein
MVRRVLVLLTISLALIGLACGGSDDAADSPSPTRAAANPSPTRAASGPQAHLEPNSGRPGTEVVVIGSGWTAGATVTIGGGSTSSQPYATATTSPDGSFTARFRLDRTANGSMLQPGRINLVAVSGSTSVTLPFDVLPPAPGGPVVGPGG